MADHKKSNRVLVSLVASVVFFALAAFSQHYFCSPALAFCGSTQTQKMSGAINQIAPHYLEYSDAALALAQSQGKTVLYFWAPWCSTCSSLDLEIQKNPALIPTGFTVLRIDYDSATALKKEYGIVTQHTFVQLDAHGKSVTTWVGGEADDWQTHLLR